MNKEKIQKKIAKKIQKMSFPRVDINAIFWSNILNKTVQTVILYTVKNDIPENEKITLLKKCQELTNIRRKIILGAGEQSAKQKKCKRKQ